MILKYIKSESTIQPETIDTTSSKTSVYLRRNVVEKTRATDSVMDGVETRYFEYEEAKLTKAEYEQYLKEVSITGIEQQRADIDYIAMLMGVDLEV